MSSHLVDNLDLRTARNDVSGVLSFAVIAGDNCPSVPHDITIRGQFEKVYIILLNGNIFSEFKYLTDDMFVINSPGWIACNDTILNFDVIFLA